MGYKVGDEVLVKAKITNIGGISATYYDVKFGCSDTALVSEKEVVADKTYDKGLADAWELARKIVMGVEDGGFDSQEVIDVFGKNRYYSFKDFTAAEALAKIEAYEKEKEIKVWDEVKGVFNDGTVTKISDNIACVLWKDGSCGKHSIDTLEKTGKHIDIESLLRQIGE